MIPETVLKQIQDRSDIVDVVGGYVPLKRAGRHFKALCPFHPEKTPSFMVNPTKQIFHCFGCGEGGDVIAFVMKYERLEFPEAVRALGVRAGVEIPTVRGAAVSRPSDTAVLMQALEFATAFFQRALQQPAGAAARAYLERRGVSAESVQALRLGWAPESWEALMTAAQAGGIAPATLERIGLVVPRERGAGWYDRFRGRVMFPVWDPKGKVVGFGGRVLDDSQPKYMNSPETEIYMKSRIVYGLHLAAPYIREQDTVAIVEGYLDFLIPYQLGVRHLVASMGTSLTPDQIQLLRRYTKRVVMVYDGDYAGELATLRGLDLLLSEGMQVRIAELPAGEDPDSAARRLGAEGFGRLLAEAHDLFVYKLDILRRRHDPTTAEGKVAICEHLLPTIKRVPNAVQRSEYVRALAEVLRVNEEALWTEIGRVKLEGTARWQPAASTPVSQAVSAERLLLGLVMDDVRYLAQVQATEVLELCQDPVVGEVFTTLMAAAEAGEEALQAAVQRLKHGETASVVAQALTLSEPIEETGRAVEDCLRRIRKNSQQRQLVELQGKIRSAEAAGDDEEAAALIGAVNQLVKLKV